MKVVYLTREYPPHVYGGAGVHVEYLAQEMAKLAKVEVKCFGDQQEVFTNPEVRGYPFGSDLFNSNPRRVRQALMVLHTCMLFNAAPIIADVVHCHTWYSMWGGILAKIAYGLPLVLTIHSLEPLRPWKREQLGRGYDLSAWVEKTAIEMADAVIAVSESDRDEIQARYRITPTQLHVIPNGIDTGQYRPVTSNRALRELGIDPARPYVLFLGRISRQKGISHFVEAIPYFLPDLQIVLCAAAPDTPELAREIETAVARASELRNHIVWVRQMISRPQAIELYSHAAVFCCPSIYEPFGLINLEAMACETPVVASAVGGIKEVVVPGETGELIAFTPVSDHDPAPADPAAFARDLARAVNDLAADEERRKRWGQKGRQRVIELYGWDRVATRVYNIYQQVVSENAQRRRDEPAEL